MKNLKVKNSISPREREREREREHCKIIIWALFDDSHSSYKKAIQKHFKKLKNIEVHSIGINNIKFSRNKNCKYFYHKIDLSITNLNLISQLKKILKNNNYPDVILASPPCESWSIADCNGRMTRSINEKGEWLINNKSFYDSYNKKCKKVKRRNFEQKETSRLIGESTIGGTIKIINHFKPKVWVIENPAKSLIWKFQKMHWNFWDEKYYENLTYYSSYDENFSLKPTIFKSNIYLDLIKKRVKGNKNHMAYGSYSKRSEIPDRLIKDMMEKIFNHLKIHNNDFYWNKQPKYKKDFTKNTIEASDDRNK